MPVLRFKPGRVEEALQLPLREALRVAERLKIEAEVLPEGIVEMEIEVDRPDMYSLEGIARQVDGILERSLGLPLYRTEPTDYTVNVENVVSRPYIAAAIVWDVDVDEDYLEELIQFQEKLHVSLGGRRELVAIGLHDLEKLPSKQLSYRLEPIERVIFEPLGGGGERTLEEVLRETEQGKKYGKISLRGRLHPVLYSGNYVISVPPVINAELTRIEPGTRHVFIDVTGTNKRLVMDTVAILAANLAERSKGKRIGLVRIARDSGEEMHTPDMNPRRVSVDARYVERNIGMGIEPELIVKHLRRMRFGARRGEGSLLHVEVPRYRIDILHPIDLVEEVVLSIGIENMEPLTPKLMLRGRLLAERVWEREARKILVGHGFIEVISYSLVDCKKEAEISGYEPGMIVKLSNPIGVESACLRASLLPGLLLLAAENQHNVPLRVFEIGEGVIVTGSGEKGVEHRKLLAIVYMAEKAGYEDIQGYVYALIRSLGDEVVKITEARHPSLIEGRAAQLETLQGLHAVMGEVRPELLEKYGIEYPVAVAEIDYTSLLPPGLKQQD